MTLKPYGLPLRIYEQTYPEIHHETCLVKTSSKLPFSLCDVDIVICNDKPGSRS